MTTRLCLSFLLISAVSSAQARDDFADESLVGSYVFSSSTDGGVNIDRTRTAKEASATMLGALVSDGSGNVIGTRIFQRAFGVEVAGSIYRNQLLETVEQAFNGTYEVNADGTGVMRLSPEPNPPWDLLAEVPNRLTFTGGGPEVLRFVLAEDGRSFRFTQEIRTTRQEAGVFRDTHFVLKGVAETQDPLEIPEPEPDPRIDILIDQLDRQDARIDILTAQLCEVLRLLNTPQGQRASDSPDVVDACGTAFAWNGEGTDGPRRGR